MIKIIVIKKNDIDKQRKYLEELLENLKVSNIKQTIEKLELAVTQEKGLCIGAFECDKLIGMLWAYKRYFSGEERYHINYFSIKKEKQGQGIGKLMITKLKEVMYEENIRIIDLNVDFENKNAKKFYKKINFKEEKILLKCELKE